MNDSGGDEVYLLQPGQIVANSLYWLNLLANNHLSFDITDMAPDCSSTNPYHICGSHFLARPSGPSNWPAAR